MSKSFRTQKFINRNKIHKGGAKSLLWAPSWMKTNKRIYNNLNPQGIPTYYNRATEAIKKDVEKVLRENSMHMSHPQQNNFFRILNTTKRGRPRNNHNFKLSNYCNTDTDKGCQKLYKYLVLDNKSETEQLIKNHNPKNIRKYVKFLLKVKNESKKVLGQENEMVLVENFLQNLKTKKEVVFFNLFNDSLFNISILGVSKSKTKAPSSSITFLKMGFGNKAQQSKEKKNKARTSTKSRRKRLISTGSRKEKRM